jgi:16S rRNA (cytosine1402-N4)-methyltransferase
MRRYPQPAHVPVLLHSCLEILGKTNPKIICDATYGNGGYSKTLLDSFDGLVIALDQDPLAMKRANEFLSIFPQYRNRFFPILGRFGDLDRLLSRHFNTSTPMVDAILFDVGLSSNQIEDSNRGFSFKREGPLDMRMASSGGLETIDSSSITAEAIVNHFPASKISDILWHYGEERQSKKIARAIESARAKGPILSTTQLAQIVADSMGFGNAWMYSKSHPATKTFQGLRIYINDELQQLKRGLIGSEHVLKPDGLCIVVTFHSLEDRLTKKFFQECQSGIVNEESLTDQIKPDPSKYKRMRRLAYQQELEREKRESIQLLT